MFTSNLETPNNISQSDRRLKSTKEEGFTIINRESKLRSRRNINVESKPVHLFEQNKEMKRAKGRFLLPITWMQYTQMAMRYHHHHHPKKGRRTNIFFLTKKRFREGKTSDNKKSNKTDNREKYTRRFESWYLRSIHTQNHRTGIDFRAKEHLFLEGNKTMN